MTILSLSFLRDWWNSLIDAGERLVVAEKLIQLSAYPSRWILNAPEFLLRISSDGTWRYVRREWFARRQK